MDMKNLLQGNIRGGLEEIGGLRNQDLDLGPQMP